MNRQFSRDEVALLRLFKRIQMRPSQHFYERMAAAPWSLHSSPANARPSFARLLATVVSVAVVLFLIAVPLRSLAQQVFHYFTQAETDVIENPVFLEPTAEQPALSDLTDVQRASEVAGFAVRLPQDLPTGLQIVSAGVNPGSVSVTYSDGQATLILLQGTKSESPFYVGAGASVETVLVDGVTGEYVRGGWRQVDDDVVWDNTLPESLLFWEKNGIRYGLLVQAGEIPKETLIQIADSLR
jgi:hypothetical protein